MADIGEVLANTLSPDGVEELIGGAEDHDAIPDESAVPWPEPMSEAAFYGLAGEVVAAILPSTEAAREAILINFQGAVVAHSWSLYRGSAPRLLP